jgi:hypothetical protein
MGHLVKHFGSPERAIWHAAIPLGIGALPHCGALSRLG